MAMVLRQVEGWHIMDPLTWEQVQRVFDILRNVAVVGGLVTTAYWFLRGIRGGLALTRARKLARLDKWRKHLVQLHDSESEYYGRMLSGVLWVLMLCATALMLDGVVGFYTDPPKTISPELQLAGSGLRHVIRYALGLWASIVAATRLRDYRELRRYDTLIKRLDRDIAKLETKIS